MTKSLVFFHKLVQKHVDKEHSSFIVLRNDATYFTFYQIKIQVMSPFDFRKIKITSDL